MVKALVVSAVIPTVFVGLLITLAITLLEHVAMLMALVNGG